MDRPPRKVKMAELLEVFAMQLRCDALPSEVRCCKRNSKESHKNENRHTRCELARGVQNVRTRDGKRGRSRWTALKDTSERSHRMDAEIHIFLDVVTICLSFG